MRPLTWGRNHHHLDAFLNLLLKLDHVRQKRQRVPAALRQPAPRKLDSALMRAVEWAGLPICFWSRGPKGAFLQTRSAYRYTRLDNHHMLTKVLVMPIPRN